MRMRDALYLLAVMALAAMLMGCTEKAVERPQESSASDREFQLLLLQMQINASRAAQAEASQQRVAEESMRQFNERINRINRPFQYRNPNPTDCTTVFNAYGSTFDCR